ncbi:MAG: sigma-70 family RNA polymerase sigma factor [Synergistaceae bacterium]|jgi:RNA polymerase sigma factor (sigma-70 family)|nr:sigma-70 family RNA polymerase sigma factor [Synergistaceae bacterium]
MSGNNDKGGDNVSDARKGVSSERDCGHGAGIEALVAEFTPLVRRTAFRYAGRGASREDLEQEGFAALLTLARRFSLREGISRVLWNYLPGMVRQAAKKMRWRDGAVSLDESIGNDEGDQLYAPEAFVADERASRDFKDAEFWIVVEAMPEEQDREIARALANGEKLGDIAEALHIDRKTLRKRIRALCDKIGRGLRGLG